jgi:hypothetical protein
MSQMATMPHNLGMSLTANNASHHRDEPNGDNAPQLRDEPNGENN